MLTLVCSMRDFRLSPLCEMSAVLEYNGAWSGSSVPTFRDESARSYHSALHKIPKEPSYQVCSNRRPSQRLYLRGTDSSFWFPSQIFGTRGVCFLEMVKSFFLSSQTF